MKEKDEAELKMIAMRGHIQGLDSENKNLQTQNAELKSRNQNLFSETQELFKRE